MLACVGFIENRMSVRNKGIKRADNDDKEAAAAAAEEEEARRRRRRLHFPTQPKSGIV